MPRKADEPCSKGCGVLLIRYPKSAAVMTCRDCRGIASTGESPHGTETRYRTGCKCDKCRSFKADLNRRFTAKFKEAHGVLPSTEYRRRTGKHNLTGLNWIEQDRRIAIYERDGWTCQICSHAIDRDADYNSKLAATLDYIHPRSLGGTDEEQNLRTAHRLCNALRGAQVEVAA